MRVVGSIKGSGRGSGEPMAYFFFVRCFVLFLGVLLDNNGRGVELRGGWLMW